jgi:hypothetical protein
MFMHDRRGLKFENLCCSHHTSNFCVTNPNQQRYVIRCETICKPEQCRFLSCNIMYSRRSYLHPPSGSKSQPSRGRKLEHSALLASLFSCSTYSLTQKFEAVHSSKVNLCWTTWCHFPEDILFNMMAHHNMILKYSTHMCSPILQAPFY